MRLRNRVAFVTGAAQGMGRAHCVRLAEEGADVIAIDLEPLESKHFSDTLSQVKDTGRRVLAATADVRDESRLKAIADEGYAAFGRIDIVVANAGVFPLPRPFLDLAPDDWSTTLNVNLTGAWHTVRATIPYMRAGGRGGSIILTSSPFGLKGFPGAAHYVASKHGVVGLMRALALEFGPEWIRVNSIHPTTVDTKLLQSAMPDAPTAEDRAKALSGFNVLPVPWIEARDVSNAVLFLASDEARYITGIALPVDAGALLK
jgi:(+)-trans-carveol dehydrogenase